MKSGLIYVIVLFCTCVGCAGGTSFIAVEGDVGPVEVSLAVDSNGQISVQSAITIIQIGSEDFLGVSLKMGVEKALNQAKGKSNFLILVWENDNGIWQQQYNVGEAFKVKFSEQEWVREIYTLENGTILVEVDVKSINPPTLSESGKRSSSTNLVTPPPDKDTSSIWLEIVFQEARSLGNNRCQLVYKLMGHGGNGRYDFFHDTVTRDEGKLIMRDVAATEYILEKPSGVNGDPFTIHMCSADSCVHEDVWIHSYQSSCQ
ncbi:MAG: hypothetical protein IPM39_07125 [Chloroflexi bacterium]|nr:hypothetical protein [Chloroflexota bacterium]